nr:hypothetical protein Iba_chr08dCG2830 [Ipomoea batatas]
MACHCPKSRVLQFHHYAFQSDQQCAAISSIFPKLSFSATVLHQMPYEQHTLLGQCLLHHLQQHLQSPRLSWDQSSGKFCLKLNQQNVH